MKQACGIIFIDHIQETGRKCRKLLLVQRYYILWATTSTFIPMMQRIRRPLKHIPMQFAPLASQVPGF